MTTLLTSLHALLHCGGEWGECGCYDITYLTSFSASLWWGVGGVWLLRHHLSHFILCFTVVGSGGSVAVTTSLISLHSLLHCGGEWGECGCDDIADLTSCSASLQWVGLGGGCDDVTDLASLQWVGGKCTVALLPSRHLYMYCSIFGGIYIRFKAIGL